MHYYITFRTLKDNQPAYLADLLIRPKCSKYLYCSSYEKAFSIAGPALWNALPVPIQNVNNSNISENT